MLNQNPPQFTCDCTTHLTHIPRYRHFSTKQTILHIKPTHLIPTKRNSDQSSSFKSPHSSISMCLVNVSPTFSRGTGIGRLHPVYISSWFMIRIYLPPNNFQFAVTSSSWTKPPSFFHEVVYDPTRYIPCQLPVGYGVIQLCNCIWRYSPAKISCALIFFCSRCLIIYLEIFL